MPFDSLLADERDANPDLSGAALNSELLRVIPQPARPSLSELSQALDRQKVVVVRVTPGLSWRSLISAVTAVLVHVLLIGSVILLTRLNPVDGTAGSGRSGFARDGGGRGSGVVGGFVIGPGEPRPGGAVVSPKPEPIPEMVRPAPVTPSIPAPPIPVPDVQKIQDKLANSEVVGLPSRTAAPKQVETQPAVTPMTSTVPPLVFAPPTKSAVTSATPAPASVSANAVASANPASGGHRQLGGGGAGGAGRGGSRLGQGPGLSDEDEDGYDLMKPGSGGRGNGKNRGASAAEKQVQVLESTPFVSAQRQLSNAQLARLHGKRVRLDVRVKADGLVGDVKILESCGDDAIDQLFVNAARQLTFMPSMKAGRAVEDTFQVSQEFGGD